mgnify:CR=1 FL=1
MSVKNFFSQSKKLFTADDPAFRIGADYRENWSRYRKSGTKIEVGGHIGTYPSPSVEPFAFHSDKEINIASVFFKASLKKVQILFPNALLRVIYIPTPLMVYRLKSESVKLYDRIRTINSEFAGPLTNFTRTYLYNQSNRTCSAIETASISVGAKFADSREYLRQTSSIRGYLHGPVDPAHFNWEGYQAIGRFISEMLNNTTTVSCATISD